VATRIVPVSWMPDGPVEAIVTHWSAGMSYRAGELDREHYHLCIEGDGKLVRGEHPISDNFDCRDHDYAAHTRGFNTKTIGVSMMCMGHGIDQPRFLGPYPIRREQWDALLMVCADLSDHYEIPVTARTLLGHGEVEPNLGIHQNGKWDPLALPWAPQMGKAEVGSLMRLQISAVKQDHKKADDDPRLSPVVKVMVMGHTLATDGFLEKGKSWIPVRDAVDQLRRIRAFTTLTQAQLLDIRETTCVVRCPGFPDRQLAFKNHGGRGFVAAAEFAQALNLSLAWKPTGRTVELDFSKG
jgi:hypothetical protein